MEPAWVIGKKGFKLGLEKNSGSEDITLTVIVTSAHKFSDENPIQINIDGDVLSLSPVNNTTDFSTLDGQYIVGEYLNSTTLASKTFLITEEIIKRMIDGEKVGIRVSMDSGEIFDGDFSEDHKYGMGAKTAFKKFYDKVCGTGK